MSEGMQMFLVILVVFGVMVYVVFTVQLKNEKKWAEEGMIDPKKDKKEQEDDVE